MSGKVLFDCTLRDGGNLSGSGFSVEFTTAVIEGLIGAGVNWIEYGNALGLGAYEKLDKKAPLTDAEYLKISQPYNQQAHLGMYLLSELADEKSIRSARDAGLSFIRIGGDAGDGDSALRGIELIKSSGLFCWYSMRKCYLLSAAEGAEEARKLEAAGADAITIMDSAGTMTPSETTEYIDRLRTTIRIPIGFHGHNNLGLSAANALAAAYAGADYLDCSLMGLARSSGNCPTEILTALLQKTGLGCDVDLYRLLELIDNDLYPLISSMGNWPRFRTEDIVYGAYGCHSGFGPLFHEIAAREGVPLFRLIAEVSKLDRKAPSRELVISTARKLAAENNHYPCP